MQELNLKETENIWAFYSDYRKDLMSILAKAKELLSLIKGDDSVKQYKFFICDEPLEIEELMYNLRESKYAVDFQKMAEQTIQQYIDNLEYFAEFDENFCFRLSDDYDDWADAFEAEQREFETLIRSALSFFAENYDHLTLEEES